MNTKTNSMNVDTSSLSPERITEFVASPINYQVPNNTSFSSIPVDMRKIVISKQENSELGIACPILLLTTKRKG